MLSGKPVTLRRRIILAMTVLVGVIALAYCLMLRFSILTAEDMLMGQMLEQQLGSVMSPAPADRQPVFGIYADNPPAGSAYPPVPEAFRGVPEGFSEVLGERDYFVYRKTEGGTTWVITRDQHGFGDIEPFIYLRSLLGMVLAVLAAALLGLLLSRAITRPVRKVSEEVKAMASEESFRPIQTVLAPDEIGEVAKTFEQTLRSLHSALDREKAFTADVSHELRTPLTVISTSAELLGMQDLSPRSREQTDRILRAVQKLRRLIHVFLFLARGGRDHDPQEDGRIADAVAAAAAERRSAAEEKGLDFRLETDPGAKRRAHMALVYSLADNLIRNAIQYTERGSITVTVDDSGIRVADTGRGISEGDRDKILGPFVRGENAPGEGYGWGLSLVRRICRHQGWELSFEPNSPRGTVFSVRFGRDGTPSDSVAP